MTGRGRYAGDIRLPGMLHAAVCRSPSPHGLLRDVRLDTARSMSGIVAAFAANDLPEIRGPIVDAVLPDLKLFARPVLAKERVRYVGEPVAVVVAVDPYLAADAANAVEIDLEPLEGCGDVTTALRDTAPSLHPPHPGNLAGRMVVAYGDIDAALAGAAVVDKHRFRLARVSGEGFKGAGESATIPAPAAIAGAVENALRKLGSNAILNEVPMTPERVFNALSTSQRGGPLSRS